MRDDVFGGCRHGKKVRLPCSMVVNGLCGIDSHACAVEVLSK